MSKACRLLFLFVTASGCGGENLPDSSNQAPVMTQAPIVSFSKITHRVVIGGALSYQIKVHNSTSGMYSSCSAPDGLPPGLILSADCEVKGAATAVKDSKFYDIAFTNSVGTDTANIDIQVDLPWSFKTGRGLTDQAPVYGTLGVGAPTNSPGSRNRSATWTDSSGNLWLFGGVGYLGGQSMSFNDLWKYDGTYWIWVGGSPLGNHSGVYGSKGVAATGNTPGSRYGSVSWIDSNNKLWLYGGYGKDSAGSSGTLGDLWVFDGTNWMWVSGANTSTIGDGGNSSYGTKGIAHSTNQPGGRENSIGWIDTSNRLWLYGSYRMSDLWKFDGTNWTWVSGSNGFDQAAVYGTQGVGNASNFPGTRSRANGWVDGSNNLYLFGGTSNGYTANAGTSTNKIHNDLWKFDGTNWIWIAGSSARNQAGSYGEKGITSGSNYPPSRAGAASWKDAEGNVWIYGGDVWGGTYSAHDSGGDLWKFDGTNWTWMSGGQATGGLFAGEFDYALLGGTSTSHPGDLYGALAWFRSDGAYIYGGTGYGAGFSIYGNLDILYKLEPL